MDIAYNGTRGYHMLIVSLANTKEVLRLVNRPWAQGLRRNTCRDLTVGSTLRGGPRRVTECRGYIDATVITSWSLAAQFPCTFIDLLKPY
jgi:hypothetical protein